MATVVVGTGDYMFDVKRNWGNLPVGWEFRDVSGVGVDSQDRLYVYQRGEHPVVVFDREGNFISSWGDRITDDAHHIKIGPDDHAYLADRDGHQVYKFTLDGELVMSLGRKHYPSLQAPFNHPTCVAVSPAGEIYVSDGYANSVVHKFAPDGELIFTWGSPGTGPGQFWVPHAIALDSEGLVYVADRENNRVQVFTPGGEYIRQWGDVFVPTDIFIDRNDICYMTERFTDRFHVFDKMGNLLSRGRVEGEGHAICADSHGDMYVAQVVLQCVDKFVKKKEA